jgi:hypothetical protein
MISVRIGPPVSAAGKQSIPHGSPEGVHVKDIKESCSIGYFTLFGDATYRNHLNPIYIYIYNYIYVYAYMHAYLITYLITYLTACLPAYFYTYIPACLDTCMPHAYIPTFPPTYMTLHDMTWHHMTIQYSTIQYNTLQSLRLIATHCNILQYITMTIHYIASPTLQSLKYVTLRCIILHYISLRLTTFHYISLHCINYTHRQLTIRIYTCAYIYILYIHMVFRVIPSSCHDCPSSGKDDERLQQREGCIAVARGYSVRGSCIFGT